MERFLIWLVLAVQGLFIALMLAYLAPWGTDGNWPRTVFTIVAIYVGLGLPSVAAGRIVWVHVASRWSQRRKRDQ